MLPKLALDGIVGSPELLGSGRLSPSAFGVGFCRFLALPCRAVGFVRIQIKKVWCMSQSRISERRRDLAVMGQDVCPWALCV